MKDNDYGQVCGDDRLEVIAMAKADIIEHTNIESSPEEMAVLNSMLLRAWQMGWLSRYDENVRDEHTSAAIAVLTKRSEVCRKVIKDRIRTGRHYDVSFFAGKREGYDQAVDLLKESTESIRIEL